MQSQSPFPPHPMLAHHCANHHTITLPCSSRLWTSPRQRPDLACSLLNPRGECAEHRSLAYSRCSVNIDWPEEGRIRLSQGLAGRGHSRQTDQSRRFRVEQAAVITGRQASHSQSHASHSQGYGFSSSHVWMWELDYKGHWVLKNWSFWTAVWEKTLQIPLDSKEIQPVHPKGNQSWIFIGRTDAEAETPILWPPDVKNWLIWKDPDAGKDWRWEEKGMTENEKVGWHHQINGH